MDDTVYYKGKHRPFWAKTVDFLRKVCKGGRLTGRIKPLIATTHDGQWV
jgi:hypothetical protein